MSQLGTQRLSWRKFDVLIRHLPPDAALYRSLTNDVLGWDLHAQLLASIADGISLGNWQRQGDSKAKRPKPIPRPGVVDNATDDDKSDTVVGPDGVERIVAPQPDPNAEVGTRRTEKKIGSVRPVGEIRSIFDRYLVAARNTSGDGD